MAKSPYKARAPLSLEDAVSRTATDLGGFPAVAALPGIRVARTTLFKYADNAEDNRPYAIPMDVAAVMTAEAIRRGQDPHLLRWFQEQTEGAAAHVKPHESLTDLVTELGADAGKTFSDLGKALKAHAHGTKKLSPRERDALLADLRDVMRVAAAGIETLDLAAAE